MTGVSEDRIDMLGGPMSAPPPLTGAPETKAPAPAGPKKGIDYSKFDAIEDSDDEKPAKATAKAKAAPAPEKPHCANCSKEISKPLRCGVCKKASYCTPQCQREDWQFHKRVCKKEEVKAPAKEADRREERPREERPRPKKKEESVVEDENISWYRHREWKPTAEPKKDFAPTQITEDMAAAAAAEPTSPTEGSVWNKAGTWEEKDVTALAQRTLRERLKGCARVDAAGGELVAEEVDSVDGEASKPVVRGKRRHLFDLSFKLKFTFRWMAGEGQKKAEGSCHVKEFTHDAFLDPDSASPPVIEMTFKAGALDSGRRQAAEAAIGARAWPPPAGSFMAQVAFAMEAWAKEYREDGGEDQGARLPPAGGF